MKIENNVIIFDNDDEMTDYCISNNPVAFYDESINCYYYDYPFTSEYNDALNSGKTFKVNCENSKIMKRGCVCRGLITKKVENLCK